ncbi:MAG TPA: peroxiredoxin family protein [Candidatus Dormibacteraeota bacterium]|nr:peroxiredoxin family protein [Candidatus Dormibacteraeota bacterium]
MTKILAGQKAPDFKLAGTSGGNFSLKNTLAKGPVVVAFFKISCPVCQFTFPFLERLHKRYGADAATFWGISQDNNRETKEFCVEYGLTFTMLLDGEGYPVSNLYGLTNVPTFFLIDPDGTVKVSCVGFGKVELEQIAAALSRRKNKKTAAVFLPSELVPAYKPG